MSAPLITLPVERQHGCLRLTKEDALGLREVLRPFEPPNLPSRLRGEQVAEATEDLCQKLYACLAKLYVEELPYVDMEMTVTDVLIINGLVKSSMWGGSDQLLLQTWAVLCEIGRRVVLKRPVQEFDLAVYTAGASGGAESGDSGAG